MSNSDHIPARSLATKSLIKEFTAIPGLVRHEQFVLPFGRKRIQGIHVVVFPDAGMANTINNFDWPQLTAGKMLLRWDQVGDIFFTMPVVVQKEWADPIGNDFGLLPGSSNSLGFPSMTPIQEYYDQRIIEVSFTDELNANLGTNSYYKISVMLDYQLEESCHD